MKAISFLSASNPLNFDKAGRLVSLRVLGTRRKLAKASFNTCHRALRDLHAEALGDRALRPMQRQRTTPSSARSFGVSTILSNSASWSSLKSGL